MDYSMPLQATSSTSRSSKLNAAPKHRPSIRWPSGSDACTPCGGSRFEPRLFV